MLLETLALSGLYDLVRFSGKLFVGKFCTDFKKAKKYAAAEVVEKYPEIFPTVNFADYIFKLEDQEVKAELEKLNKGIETIDENLLITAVEKDLSEQFPGAKGKIKEVVSYFKKCMTEKLQENHEILNYFTHKKVENIVDLLKGVKINLDVLLSACRKQVEREVAKVGKKYIPALYINREIEKEFELFVNEEIKTSGNCFLIIDRAGSGKTNLLCSLARKYNQEQPAVLVLGTIFLKDEFGIEEYIKKSLEYDPNVKFSSFQQCLEELNDVIKSVNSNAIIFIDAINENIDTYLMKRAVENILSKHSEKRFKFCITCRDLYWDFFKAEFWEEYACKTFQNQLYDFTSEEFEQALERYFAYFNIRGELKDEALEKCKHPLLLRFFCEAFKDTDIDIVPHIRLDELFDGYWKKKIRSIAKKIPDRLHPDKQVENYLFSIAREMFQSHLRSILSIRLEEVTGEKNIYHRDSIYTKILDEDIILEEELIEEGKEETRVVFVYEEFMEYVMAREIFIREKLFYKNEEEIFKVIEGLVNDIDKFTTIFGIMVYLGLILKKVKDLSIWKLLIKKGPRCQEIIFESIRKLPTKEIEKSVFGVLEELVDSGKKDTRQKVLDILSSKIFMESNKEDVIKILAILINDEDWEIRKKAAKALGQTGSDKAVDLLIQASNDKFSIVRATAVQSMKEIGSEKAVEPLINALKEDQFDIRESAAVGLGIIKSEKAVDPLINALRDYHIEVRESAVVALGKIKSEKAVKPLIKVLRDNDHNVRKSAVMALLEIKSEKAVDSIINALSDNDWKVRISVLDALDKLKWEPKTIKDKAIYLVAKRKWEECVEIGEPALKPLIKALSYDDQSVRDGAVKALGRIKSKKAVKPLIKALEDYDSFVRMRAADALGVIKSKGAVEPLIYALKDNDIDVRMSAAWALGEIKSERAVDSLINALKDEDYDVRDSAIVALGKIKSAKAVEPLIKALENDYRDVRRGAVRALGEIKSERAVDSLINALKDGDYDVRDSAIVALGKIKSAKAVEPLIKALEDDYSEVRCLAAEALGDIKSKKAVDPLIYALFDDDWDVSERAADALREIGTPKALKAVERYEEGYN